MTVKLLRKRIFIICIFCVIVSVIAGCNRKGQNYIINVSYDPTREFYESYNKLFQEHWKEKTGENIDIIQSHGGSGKQALEVANGLEADVVTLALEQDINQIRDAGLISDGYISNFPEASAPYTSTIVFMVRAGNPKNINDWNDLLKDDVGVITPNPKTSGGARWNYLAAWYYFEGQGYAESEIVEAMTKLYKNVLVLDSGARASTTTFVENGQGDVLITWENEAFYSLQEYPGEYEIIIPSASVLCQPTVALVDEMVTKHGTKNVATEYLNYLYEDASQELIARSYYRPIAEKVYEKYKRQDSERVIKEVPEDGRWLVDSVDVVTIEHFGGWEKTTEVHFKDNGYFDSIFK